MGNRDSYSDYRITNALVFRCIWGYIYKVSRGPSWTLSFLL